MKATARFWQQHALAAERSSSSTSAYAKRHGLAVSTLYYWQSKLKASMKVSTPTGEVSPPAAKFVALRVVDAANAPRANHCTLILSAGMRLEMTALPAPEWLAALGQAVLGHAAQGAR